MPFEEKFVTLYEKVIKPIVESKGLECRRADDYKTNKEIMKDIWGAICQSRIVVAEMTGFNPNVMYELGISHTVGKETIMMTKNLGEEQKFPFDMAHIRRIQYHDSVGGYSAIECEFYGPNDIEGRSQQVPPDTDDSAAHPITFRSLMRIMINGRTKIFPSGYTVTIMPIDPYYLHTINSSCYQWTQNKTTKT
jgi:hypothetical protein